VVENQVDFTKSRNVLIAAMILVLSIGLKYGTGDIGGITFLVGGVNIQLSSLAIAAVTGIAMNAVLPGKDYEFGTNQQGDTAVNFGARHN
jgi:uracil permease